MSNFISAVKAFATDEDGITAIEYGLMAALIGVAIVGGATALGTNLSDAFKAVGNKITNTTAKL
jgi:pilus assembly protein Flp/PilA